MIRIESTDWADDVEKIWHNILLYLVKYPAMPVDYHAPVLSTRHDIFLKPYKDRTYIVNYNRLFKQTLDTDASLDVTDYTLYGNYLSSSRSKFVLEPTKKYRLDKNFYIMIPMIYNANDRPDHCTIVIYDKNNITNFFNEMSDKNTLCIFPKTVSGKINFNAGNVLLANYDCWLTFLSKLSQTASDRRFISVIKANYLYFFFNADVTGVTDPNDILEGDNYQTLNNILTGITKSKELDINHFLRRMQKYSIIESGYHTRREYVCHTARSADPVEDDKLVKDPQHLQLQKTWLASLVDVRYDNTYNSFFCKVKP